MAPRLGACLTSDGNVVLRLLAEKLLHEIVILLISYALEFVIFPLLLLTFPTFPTVQTIWEIVGRKDRQTYCFQIQIQIQIQRHQ